MKQINVSELDLDSMSEEECSLLLLEGLAKGSPELEITKVFLGGTLIHATVYDPKEQKEIFTIRTKEYEDIRVERK